MEISCMKIPHDRIINHYSDLPKMTIRFKFSAKRNKRN